MTSRIGSHPTVRSGGRILVDQLLIQGTSTVFCLPGESYLPVLDALYEQRMRIRTVSCRHEANAANMADAHGKLTGRPGVCFVSRGPGAMQASVGVHTAMQDSTPMILFIGQVPRGHRDREAFQELPYERVFGHVAKWTATIDSVDRIPEYVARAYQVAISGRPGPVVLALPVDILSAESVTADAARVRAAEAAPDERQVEALLRLLEHSQRPLFLVGGSGWDTTSIADMVAFAERNHLPVASTFRRQDVFNNESSSYVGTLGAGGPAQLSVDALESDLLVLVGARLDSITTQRYSVIQAPTPGQTFVHVHPSPDEIGIVSQADIAIPSSVGAFARALSRTDPLDTGVWRTRTAELRERHVVSCDAETGGRQLDIASVVMHLRERMPVDTIYASGAGNYTAWCHRFLRFSTYPSQLAPTSGAMGYGLPAAIAAALEFPHRPVVALAGDGDFLMASPDLITAADLELPIVVVVLNNGMYGTIRMHQEKRYPGRVIATTLKNPHFADLARASGWHGETVTRDEEFAPALERSLLAGRPALIDVHTEPDQISLDASLTDLRVNVDS